jgi:ATP-dependent protease Clp ATPase subunit
MKTFEQAAPVSAVVADHQLVEALHKYARVSREIGNEADVAWALDVIRGLDLQAAEKAAMKSLLAHVEIKSALKEYKVTAETQGRIQHVSVVNHALRNLDRKYHLHNTLNALEQKLNARIDAVGASIPRKK